MAWTRQRITYTTGVAFVLSNLVVGALLVSNGGVRVRQAAATPAPTHPATPSRSPSSPAQLRSPFTGEPVSLLTPVLAVEIDNSAPARPQTGLTDADIVYVLPVEGGLSRLMAIFSSHYPTVAGPVRSARQDDLTLLRQFGTPGFAYSGATPRLLRYIHRTRPDREPVRGHQQRVLPQLEPGRAVQPVRLPARPAGDRGQREPGP